MYPHLRPLLSVCLDLSLLDHHNWNTLSSPNVRFRQYGKLRFKVLPQAGEIRLTPVLQLALSKSSAGWPVAFDNSEVLGLWQQLVPPADPSDPFYPPALFRLVTAFAGIVFGAELCQRIADVLADAASTCELSLVLDDTRLVFARKIETSCQRLQSRKRWAPRYVEARDVYPDPRSKRSTQRPRFAR